MEEGDPHHQSGRESAPVTRDDAIEGAASSDPGASRRSISPAQFVSADMWHGRGIAERERNSVGARILAGMGYKVGMRLGKEPWIRVPLERPYIVGARRGGVHQPTPSSATENLQNP